MGIVNSIAESLVECLFRPVRQDFEAKTHDLNERLAAIELLHKRLHLNPGGLGFRGPSLCCGGPAHISKEQWRVWSNQHLEYRVQIRDRCHVYPYRSWNDFLEYANNAPCNAFVNLGLWIQHEVDRLYHFECTFSLWQNPKCFTQRLWRPWRCLSSEHHLNY